MKYKLLMIFVLQLVLLSCKSSSVSKQELVIENRVLKERLAQLEKIDTLNIEAIVEVNKMNVVYRGIFNPLTIQVKNAKNVIASAPGLRKLDDYGNYRIAPTMGSVVEIKIEAEMYDGSKIIKNKSLRIRDIGRGRTLFKGRECNKCNLKLDKSELKNGEITFNVIDFQFDSTFEIVHFKIKFPGKDSIFIEGNTLDDESKKVVDSLETGDLVQIFDLGLRSSLRYCKVSPIIIEIKE